MIVVNEICNFQIFQGKEQERKKRRKKRIQKKLQVNDYSHLEYAQQTQTIDLVLDDDPIMKAYEKGLSRKQFLNATQFYETLYFEATHFS